MQKPSAYQLRILLEIGRGARLVASASNNGQGVASINRMPVSVSTLIAMKRWIAPRLRQQVYRDGQIVSRSRYWEWVLTAAGKRIIQRQGKCHRVTKSCCSNGG